MQENIRLILQHTPIWVFILFVYLIFIGIKATKGGVVHIKKLVIMPLVLTFLSCHTLINIPWTSGLLLGFFIMLVAGFLFAWQLIRGQAKNIKVDRTKQLLQLPGTCFTLVLVIVIFLSKYYIGMRIGMDPAIIYQLGFSYFTFLLNGLTTGLLIGRVAHYFYLMQTSESVRLKLEEDA